MQIVTGKTLSTLAILAVVYSTSLLSESQKNCRLSCSVDLGGERRFTSGARASSHVTVNPSVRLIGIAHDEDGRNRVSVSVHTYYAASRRHHSVVYESFDRGVTWLRARVSRYYSSSALVSEPVFAIVSIADSRVMYRQARMGGSYEVSRDYGLTWATVRPTLLGGERISRCSLVATGTKRPERLYAAIVPLKSPGG